MGSIIVTFYYVKKGLKFLLIMKFVVEEGHLALETIKGLGAYPVLYGPLSSPEYFPLP